MPPSPILTSFCVTVTWMDSLKDDFYCWSSQTKTHLEPSFWPTLTGSFFLLLKNKLSGWYLLEFEALAFSDQKIKINTIETKQHRILKCPFLTVAHPGLVWLLHLERPPRLHQITNTAAVVQLVICQVDMHKSSFLPARIVHHIKRIVFDV